MSEQYTHLLISRNPEFVPAPGTIAAFFTALSALGATPHSPELSVGRVVRVTPEARRGVNPFTGEVMLFKGPSRKVDRRTALTHLSQLEAVVNGWREYTVSMTGTVPARVPPFPISIDGPCHFCLECNVRSTLVSTSDAGSRIDPAVQSVPRFNEDATMDEHVGYFINPHTNEEIAVPEAGCARFWVSFELGKWVFPEIEQDFDVLDQRIVSLAEQQFEVRFAQGCRLY